MQAGTHKEEASAARSRVSLKADHVMSKSSSHVDHLVRDLIKGLGIILFVIGVKIALEHTFIGEEIEQTAYRLIQHGLKRNLEEADIHVCVVDTSKLDPAEWRKDGRVGKATPRPPLKALIEAIAAKSPRSIAIDIDFSPDDAGSYIHPDDPDFFNFCLKVWEETHVPIILGVGRHQAEGPSAWLGDARFAPLAASISVDDPRRLPRWLGTAINSQPIPSLSSAAADWERWPFEGEESANGRAVYVDHRPPPWLEWACEAATLRHGASRGHDVQEYLVDYSALSALQRNRLQTIEPTAVDALPEKFADTVVFVGRGTWGSTVDTFNVAGAKLPVPGVYLHACGAYTLMQGPMYELTLAGRIVIDLALSVALLVLVIGTRAYYRARNRDVLLAAHRLHDFLTNVAVVAVLILGVFLVRLTRLMWDDFLFVTIALLAHSTVEERVTGLVRSLRDFAKGFVTTRAMRRAQK